MIFERLIGLDDRPAWREALANIPHGFAHTWDCCHAMHLTTGFPTFLYCAESGGERAVCPFAERGFEGALDICTPYGFSGFAGTGAIPGLNERWRAFARDRAYVCGYFALHPKLALGDVGQDRQASNSLFLIDLRAGIDAAFGKISRSRRRTLRAWEASGRSFVEEKEPLIDFIVAEHEPFMRSVDADGAAFLGAESLRAFCSSEHVQLLGIGDAGNIVAVHAFAFTRWDSESLFFLGKPEARGLMPALFWEAVKRTAEKGLPFFNMGGGVREGDAVALSKKLYGPDEYPISRVKEIYVPDEYARLCKERRVDPGDMSGYFPPYRSGAPSARME